MGTVVAARHAQIGHTVALKLLHAHLATEGMRERFLREARAIAKIQSPHVVSVIDVGTAQDGTPFIVLELLDGQDLGAMVSGERTLPEARAVDLVEQACRGLRVAHAQGIVHRDLKPANLFVVKRADGSPLVKVVDFGIAKRLADDAPPLTNAATVMGSPKYMAPEQVGAARDVDARADVWALGIILFRLMTGKTPFERGSASETMLAVALEPAPPLGSGSAGLRAIVARALARDPAARFRDAGELGDALARLASGAAEPPVTMAESRLSPMAASVEDRRAQPTVSAVLSAPVPVRAASSPALSGPTLASSAPVFAGDPARVASSPYQATVVSSGAAPTPAPAAAQPVVPYSPPVAPAPPAHVPPYAPRLPGPQRPAPSPGLLLLKAFAILFAVMVTLGGIVVVAGGAGFASLLASSESSKAPLPPGDARRIDPVAMLQHVLKVARRRDPAARVREIRVMNHDGTGLVNVVTGDGISYDVDAGRSSDDATISITVTSTGMASMRVPVHNPAALPAEPTCPLPKVVKAFQAAGVAVRQDSGLVYGRLGHSTWRLTDDDVKREVDGVTCLVKP